MSFVQNEFLWLTSFSFNRQTTIHVMKNRLEEELYFIGQEVAQVGPEQDWQRRCEQMQKSEQALKLRMCNAQKQWIIKGTALTHFFGSELYHPQVQRFLSCVKKKFPQLSATHDSDYKKLYQESLAQLNRLTTKYQMLKARAKVLRDEALELKQKNFRLPQENTQTILATKRRWRERQQKYEDTKKINALLTKHLQLMNQIVKRQRLDLHELENQNEQLLQKKCTTCSLESYRKQIQHLVLEDSRKHSFIQNLQAY